MNTPLSDPNLLKTKAFINGEWVDSCSAETFVVNNPANLEMVATVSKCGAEETKAAIAAAHHAFSTWSKLAPKKRSELIEVWGDLIVAHADDLAAILTAEQGKPLAEAKGEILYGASYIKWFSEEAKRVYGDTLANPSSDTRVVCIKQPIGVVACITPWNFPNAMLARKIAPALAVGCTVVCKPANETPLSALAITELAVRAGIPKGVINVVAGNTTEIGRELTASSLVRKLTFTGSTPVGKKLMADCAATMKRTSMELGGNAPFIVFEDADIDQAIDGLMVSKFRNAGQTCVCSNRILVQSSIIEQFIEKLVPAVANLKMGEGVDDEVTVGPLIHEKAANGVRGLIDDAIKNGAKVVAGGTDSGLGASFVTPTVLTNVTDSMKIFANEIFGPVAPIFSFDTEEQAIAMANDTPFGLAAYFYSRDIGRVWRVFLIIKW